MTKASSFSMSDATRALKAAVAAGLKPSAYKVDIDGSIVVMFGDDSNAPRRNPLDRLLEQ